MRSLLFCGSSAGMVGMEGEVVEVVGDGASHSVGGTVARLLTRINPPPPRGQATVQVLLLRGVVKVTIH